MVTIGKNILENLTTGMYADSKVAYREYIQNACDQIDIAISQGLLSEEEALIDIFIDKQKRYISVRDNATGVSSSTFRVDLGDIANSNKEQGKSKGFRGIGRLCGLAYCKTLQFKTSYHGEAVGSIMICDAERMREMLRERKKYTIEEILLEIIEFDMFDEDIEPHYFEVELIDINTENTELLDEKKVKSYLSFVSPVPYKREFLLCNQIYDYATSLDFSIDEYTIKVNGEQVLKEYTSKLKEQSGTNLRNYDEIYCLKFKNFLDSNGGVIAWMWFGLSRFEKSIPKINAMRGLRVRQENIQIGSDNTLQPFFKEPRGNHYFVGEVFTVSANLIANSQRDYFNETETRVLLEDEMRVFFHEELHKLYHSANEIKNNLRKQEDLLGKVREFEEKSTTNSFVDERAKQKLEFEIEQAKKEADKASKRLEKYDAIDNSSPIYEVNKRINEKFKATELTERAQTIDIQQIIAQEPVNKKGSGYAADCLSKLDKKERKLVSKIWSIITNNAPKEVAENLIEKIKEEFR